MKPASDVAVDLPAVLADDLDRVEKQLVYFDVLIQHRDERERRRKRAETELPSPSVKTAFRLPASMSSSYDHRCR